MAEVVGLRDVHELLWKGTRPFAAFIQYGTSETGYSYDVICPFCGLTVGQIDEKIEADGPEDLDPRQLSQEIKTLMVPHRISCTASGFRLAVRKATQPLNTEQRARVM